MHLKLYRHEANPSLNARQLAENQSLKVDNIRHGIKYYITQCASSYS